MAQKTISQLPLKTSIVDPNSTFMAVDGLTDTNAISVANFFNSLPPYLKPPENFPLTATDIFIQSSRNIDLSLPENRNLALIIEGIGEQIDVVLIRGTMAYEVPFYIRVYADMTPKPRIFVYSLGNSFFRSAIENTTGITASSGLIEGYYFWLQNTAGNDCLIKIL